MKYQNNGFSMVELMIVVGIIGILASVAIPNFKRYAAKSRQTEGEIALTAFYLAVTTYMENSNNGLDDLANAVFTDLDINSSPKYFVTCFREVNDSCNILEATRSVIGNINATPSYGEISTSPDNFRINTNGQIWENRFCIMTMDINKSMNIGADCPTTY